MPLGRVTTQQELLDLFLDPAKFKSMAAELAQNSDAPSFEGTNFEEFVAGLDQQQQIAQAVDFAQGQPGAPGVNIPSNTTALPTAGSIRSGNEQQGFDMSKMMGMFSAMGSAAKQEEGPPMPSAPTPVPTKVGGPVTANPVKMPPRESPEILGLLDLLARR